MRQSDFPRAWRPRIRWWLGIGCLVALGAMGALIPLGPAAHGASGTAPSVTLVVRASPLRGQVAMQAFATPTTGRTITRVDFQISPAAQNQWTTLATSTAAPYRGTLDTTNPIYVPQNGPYDLRAVATDDAGQQGISALAEDRVVANNASYVALANPGTPIRRSLTLTATPALGGNTPDTVTFEICPVSTNCLANSTGWATIATVGPQQNAAGNPTGKYVTTLDTSSLADGRYDLTVTATDAASDAFQGGVVGHLLVDNTPPTATLDNPGSSLSDVVTLTGSAQDAGAGVSAVKFESSPAGADSWTTIGVATSPPYSASFDTRQLADGSYDLRTEATDAAGNTAASPVASGVTVSNPNAQRFDNLAITNYVAPATSIELLGEIAGSPAHETWALGQTDAPPPTVNGAPLPYTAQGNGQWVVLRYTDDADWQIVDVLRNPDGSPFQLNPASPAQVSGKMTTAGEAWITLQQQHPGSATQNEVFHRVPGGQFLLDPNASNALAPLLASGPPRLRLGVAPDGATYGTLLPSQSPRGSVPGVPSPTGPTAVTTFMQYGELVDGTWTVPPAPLPDGYTAPSTGVTITLDAADPTGPGTGWALLDQKSLALNSRSLILARFDHNVWNFVGNTGLDALDLTNEFAPSSHESAGAPNAGITGPFAIRADSRGVWIGASIFGGSGPGTVVARYDISSGRVVDSWCTGLPRQSFGCAQPLDADHPAAVPDGAFDTSDGIVADALSTNVVDVYAHGAWTSAPAPGFGGFNGGEALFVDPTDGWLVGANVLARVSATPPPGALASWPEPNRAPLMSAALPPGQSTTDTTGALAVGLKGTALHYDASAGWQVDPTPPRAHHIGLYGVAFAGPSSAFAVGQEGTILRWDGTSWSEDPQSVSLTTATLNTVAFGADGQGWAVGGNGTILHYDGTAWSAEQVDAAESDKAITSVAVAGADAFAIAGGQLIERQPDGTWNRVDPSLLPAPAPPVGSLKRVAGLPDGGLAVAGKSLLMIRQNASASFKYASQSFQGIPVALAAFRGPAGDVRAFVSVAPPVTTAAGVLTGDVGGFPAGDGDLLVQTDGGWHDLSRAQSPAQTGIAQGDGFVQSDPVLAVAASPDGSHAWAIGGYSGTHTADGIGTDAILSARPAGWLASSIWRYDAGGSVQSSAVTSEPPSLPAKAGTVSFAFFSGALCKIQCAAVRDAQPDVNLRTAAEQIAAFAQQSGGPAFAMLGGNARGKNAVDVRHLGGLLSPLGGVPTYAAYGPLDAVPTSSDPSTWAEVFAQAPAPFGSAAAPTGIAPAGSGDPTGPVNKYYAFDASQNGGTLRVIVLDNSAGSLEASAPGQTAWLSGRLADAQAAGLPVVVVAAKPLNSNDLAPASDGDALAAQLAAAGVLAVFTASDGTTAASQPDRVAQVPANAPLGAPQIPEYEGATLTYQQPKNNGVLWYDVAIDTVAATVSVKAIPVIASLSLEPLSGLTAARSSTLSFQAIGRRPPATIATTPANDSFPGFDQYVEIPASNCSGCIGPSYTFKSSNKIVGDFVAASGPGSPYPKLDSEGRPIRSSSSGLFCAFNSGTTTVSVTSGLLTSSLPVTVKAGGFGPPCGTVPGGVNSNVITLPGRVITGKALNPGVGLPLQPAASPSPTPLPKVALPPAPAPAVHPAPAPHAQPVFNPATTLTQQAAVGLPPIVVPLIPPALTPVPPGGATVSAQAAAKREEKARKHASQSAYVTRPAGTSASEWFYPAVGAISVLAALMIAGGMRPGPRPKLALVEVRESDHTRRRPGRR